MLDFIFLGFALLLWLPTSSSGPDQPFASGFESNVYISTDRPDTPVWTIDSTNHNAAVVTSTTYLTDGKVSIPTRFTWDVGAQTITSYVSFDASFPAMTVASGQLIVFATLFPNTQYAPPPGVEVVLIFFNGGTPVSVATAFTVSGDNGGVTAITTGDAGAITFDSVRFALINNLSGSTWATSGQVIDVGEVWFGTLTEFKNTTDPKRKLVDIVTNRRSHNLTNQPLFGGATYYQWTYTFTPMSESSTYSGSTIPTYSQVEYAMSQAKSMLIIGRIFVRGTTTKDIDSIKYSTAFGRPANDGLRELQAHKDGPYWVAGLTFETQSAG